MASNIEKIADEIDELEKKGLALANNLADSINKGGKGEKFRQGYDAWYTVSRRVIAQLIPEREEDFTTLYRYTKTRKTITYENYCISDFLHGSVVSRWDGSNAFDPAGRAYMEFQIQVQILQSARTRAKSLLMDIKDVLAADLFDDELEKARALHKNKLLREAGVISGVVLESHLQKVADAHNVKINKKDPTIGDLNDPLKNAGVYDVPTWRLIQRLADIRNLCDHKKHRDPTSDEVIEFIDGTDKISKTVF